MNRSAPLRRNTPLPPGKPLARASGLRQGGGLRVVQLTPARTQRKPQRDTGFSASVKLQIRTRAGNGDPCDARCEVCGVWLGLYGGQVHHRLNRKSGGRRGAGEARVNAVTNAALACGTPETGCHGRATRQEAAMKAMGFVLSEDQDPALEPVMLHGEQGGVTVWLTPDGGYSTEAPRGDAA